MHCFSDGHSIASTACVLYTEKSPSKLSSDAKNLMAEQRHIMPRCPIQIVRRWRREREEEEERRRREGEVEDEEEAREGEEEEGKGE